VRCATVPFPGLALARGDKSGVARHTPASQTVTSPRYIVGGNTPQSGDGPRVVTLLSGLSKEQLSEALIAIAQQLAL